MDKQNLFRLSLTSLPLSVKILFTSFLLTMALGYFMAFWYLFLVNIAPHQDMGMDVLEGIVHKYYGSRKDTRLESALKGSMGKYVSDSEYEKIIGWIQGGASEENFSRVKQIFRDNCAGCHAPGSGLGVVPLTSYEEIKSLAEVDLGESIKTLAGVSHVHFFGISFIFIWTGLIFVLGGMRSSLKTTIILIPFIAIWLDIGSWWFTKYEPFFAYTVISGSILMSLAFAIQVLSPLYEMWLGKNE